MAPGRIWRCSRRLTGNKNIKAIDLSPSGLLPILRPLLAATLPFAAVTLAFGLDASPKRSAGGVSSNALYVDAANEATPEETPVVDRGTPLRQVAGRGSSGQSTGKPFVAASLLVGRYATSAPAFAPASFSGAHTDIVRPTSGLVPDFANFAVGSEERTTAATRTFDQPTAQAAFPSLGGPEPSLPSRGNSPLDLQGSKPLSVVKPSVVDSANPEVPSHTFIYFPDEFPPGAGFYFPTDFQLGAGDQDVVGVGGLGGGASDGLAAAGFALGPDAVAPVPEPATYAFMLAGLGLIGFVSGKRRRVRCN